jgi:hypothetical protein
MFPCYKPDHSLRNMDYFTFSILMIGNNSKNDLAISSHYRLLDIRCDFSLFTSSITKLHKRMKPVIKISFIPSLSLCLSLLLRSKISQHFYYSQTVAGLLICGALPDERTGLSFTISAGSRQRSHLRFPVPWNSRPYFSASDSRLLFS